MSIDELETDVGALPKWPRQVDPVDLGAQSGIAVIEKPGHLSQTRRGGEESNNDDGVLAANVTGTAGRQAGRDCEEQPPAQPIRESSPDEVKHVPHAASEPANLLEH